MHVYSMYGAFVCAPWPLWSVELSGFCVCCDVGCYNLLSRSVRFRGWASAQAANGANHSPYEGAGWDNGVHCPLGGGGGLSPTPWAGVEPVGGAPTP